MTKTKAKKKGLRELLSVYDAPYVEKQKPVNSWCDKETMHTFSVGDVVYFTEEPRHALVIRTIYVAHWPQAPSSGTGFLSVAFPGEDQQYTIAYHRFNPPVKTSIFDIATTKVIEHRRF